MLRQTLVCLQKITGVRGKQAASDGTLPCFSHSPFPSTRRHERKRRKRRTERGEERERGASRRKSQRDPTIWIMQSCQRRLLLEVLAVLKESSRDLHQLHQPLSPLPMAERRLIHAPENGQQQDEEEVGWGGGWPLGDRWIVLEGHTGPRQVHSLLPLFTEVTDREIWAGSYSGPRGNIITEQRLSEDMQVQHSGQQWPVEFCKLLVCWSQESGTPYCIWLLS